MLVLEPWNGVSADVMGQNMVTIKPDLKLQLSIAR